MEALWRLMVGVALLVLTLAGLERGKDALYRRLCRLDPPVRIAP